MCVKCLDLSRYVIEKLKFSTVIFAAFNFLFIVPVFPYLIQVRLGPKQQTCGVCCNKFFYVLVAFLITQPAVSKH